MEKSSFLVTGAGRSGTKFLSETLNRSRIWNVLHEHSNDHLYYESPTGWNAEELRSRFGSEHYGEVNSQLRRIAPALSNRGLRVYFIVRHPRDIIKSVHKARGRTADQFLDTLYEVLPAFTDVFLLKLLGFKYFKFEKMVTDKMYLYDMMIELGVDDVQLSSIDLTKKINTHGKSTINAWDLSLSDGDVFLDKCGWFMRAFGYRR